MDKKLTEPQPLNPVVLTAEQPEEAKTGFRIKHKITITEAWPNGIIILP